MSQASGPKTVVGGHAQEPVRQRRGGSGSAGVQIRASPMDLATIAGFQGNADARLGALERDVSSMKDDVRSLIPAVAGLSERAKHVPTTNQMLGMLAGLIVVLGGLGLIMPRVQQAFGIVPITSQAPAATALSR